MVVDNVSTGGAKSKAKKVTQSSTTSKQATASNSKTLTKKKTLPKKLPATKGAKGKNSGEEKKEKPTTNKEMVAASTTSTSGGPRIQAQRKFAQAGNIYTGTVNHQSERPGPTREGDKAGAPAKKQASVKRPAPTSSGPLSGIAPTTSTASATKKLKARPAFSPPPNKRPKTEDFLTFLCFRGTPALPPDLAYLNYPPLPDELSFLPKKKSVASNLTESITKASNGFIHSEEESLSKSSLQLQPPPVNSLPASASKSESKESAPTPPKASTSKANQKSAESLAENPTKGIRATASSVLLSKMNTGSSKATGKQNTSLPAQQSSKSTAAATTKAKPILSPTRSRLNEQDARFAMTALRSSFQYQRLASSKLTKKAKERTGILTRSKASVILSPGTKLCARKAVGKFSVRGARKSPIISPSRNAPSPDIIFGVTSSSGRKRLPRSARSSSTESEDVRKKKSSNKSTSEESVEEDDDEDVSSKKTTNTRSNSSKEERKKPTTAVPTGRALRSGKELFTPSTNVTKETSEPSKKSSVGRASERRVGTRSAQRMTKSPLRELPMWNSKKPKDDDDSESDDSEEESEDEKKKSTKQNKKKSDSTDEEDSKQNKGKKKQIAEKNTKKLSTKSKQPSSSDDESDDKRTVSTRAKGKRGEVPSKKGKVAERRGSAKPKSESEDESSEDDGKKKLRGRRGSVLTNKPKKKGSTSEEEESSEDESVKKKNKKGVKTSSTGSAKKRKDESSEEEVIQKKGKGKKKEETDDENDEKESEDEPTAGKKAMAKSRVSKRGRASKEETVENKSSDDEEDESESDQKSKERTSLRSKRTANKEEKEQVKKRPSRQTKETAALCLGLYKFTTDEEGSSEEDEKSKKKKEDQDEDVEGSSSCSETKFLEKHYNASLKKEQQEKSKKKSSQMKTRPKRKESMKEESEEEDEDVPSSSKNEQGKTKGKKKKQAESKKKGKAATEDEEEKDDDSTEEEEKQDKKLPPPASKESSPAASNKRKMRQTTPTVGDRKMPGAARKSAAIVSRRRSRYSSSSSSSKDEVSSDADEEGEEVTFSGEEKEKQPVKDDERTKTTSKEPKAIATEMRRLVSESVSPPGEPGSGRRREQSVETEQCRLESPPVQPSSSSSGEDSSSGEEEGNVPVTVKKVTIAIQCDMDEDPEAEKLISPHEPTVESPTRQSPVGPAPPIVVDDGSNDSVQEIGQVFATQPPQHTNSSSSTSSAPSSSTAASSSAFPGIFTAPAPPPPSSMDYNPFLSSFYTPLHLTPPAQPPPPNPFLSTHFQHLQQQQSSAGAATSSSMHMSNPLNTLSIPVSIPPHPMSHSHHHLAAHPMSFQSFQTSTIHHHIRTTHTNLDNISLVRPPAIPGFPHQSPLTRPMTGLWPQQPGHAASSSTSSTASSYSAFRVPHLVPPGQGQAATVIHHQSTTVTQLPVSIVQPQGSLFQPHHGIHHPHTTHHTHHHNHQQQPGPSSSHSMPSTSCTRAPHSQDKKSHPKTHHSHQHHQQQHKKCSGNQSSVDKKQQQQPQPHQSTVQPPGYNIIKNLPNVSIVPKFDRNAQPKIIPGKSAPQPSTSSSSKTKKDDKKEEVKPTTKETASISGLPPPPVEKKKPGRKKKVEQALILPQPTSPLTVRKDSTTPATYHSKKPLFKKEEGDPQNDVADGDQAAPSPAVVPSTSKKTSGKKTASKGSSGDKNCRSKSPPAETAFKLPKMQPNGLRDAPTFHPTDAEFEDPLKYIMKVQFIAGKYGMARIVPPKSFRPECNVEDDMRFTAYNHYVHRMWQRWGPNTAEATAIVENVRGSGVDTDELPAIIGGLEIDLALLYRTVRSFGGLKEVIEKEKWARVADAMHVPKAAHDRASKLDGIYVKYVLPYEILSAVERDKLKKRVEKNWCKRKERILKTHEKEQGNSSHSSDSEASNGSSDDEMAEIDECIVKGKSTPLSSYYRVARNTQNMFFTGDKSSPSVDEVEDEYWRLVRERTQPVTVYSGSIDCAGGVGWGFPMPTNKGNHHPWNLKVLANNQGSVLRSMGHVMGATVPTLHVSMLFTTYCWYRDPHSLPWVEYLHSGADKIWYAVPPEEERSFRSVLSALMPLQVQKNKKIWLASDSAMVPPNLLLSRGVPLVKAVQRPGEFLVVFPKAFTSAVCTGYLISESVCFAYPSWLSSCLQTFQEIRESKEPPVFPLEKLLLSILQDARASLEVVRLAIPPTKEVVKDELSLRKKLISLGVKLGGKLLQKGNSSKESEGGKSASKSKAKKKRNNGISANSDTEEEVEQCYVCNYLLWISLVRNTKTDSAMCLKHAIEHFAKHKADVKKSVLLYDMDEAQLEDLVSNASNRCGNQKPGSSSSAST